MFVDVVKIENGILLGCYLIVKVKVVCDNNKICIIG